MSAQTNCPETATCTVADTEQIEMVECIVCFRAIQIFGIVYRFQKDASNLGIVW
jgi:hypothetical protein